MKRYLKYFLAVAALVLVCATCALADGEVVATVNGQPYDSLASALSSASSGDSVIVVSSSTVSSTVSVPSGVHLLIPQGVTLNFSGNARLSNYGTLRSYGSLVRENSTDNVALVYSGSGSSSYFYGDVYTSSSSGTAIQGEGTADVRIFGGTFHGARYAAIGLSGAPIYVYGGTFSANEYSPIGSSAVFPFGTPSPAIRVDGVYYRNGSDFFAAISSIVSNGLQWISLFCACLVANKLLLFFILFALGFAGIGLIKRIVR